MTTNEDLIRMLITRMGPDQRRTYENHYIRKTRNLDDWWDEPKVSDEMDVIGWDTKAADSDDIALTIWNINMRDAV